MKIYETLMHLATNPHEQELSLHKGLLSIDAILNELKNELSDNNLHCQSIDMRQASETMVYKN